jgi:Bacteriophage tail sheath protein
MPQVSYPGVYIQEVPSGVHTITSVATSITAFIDFFAEGPMNEAVEIFGMTDFQRVFGGLDDRSEGSYAISQFFLNGGGTALVIRVAAFDGTHPLLIFPNLTAWMLASLNPAERARVQGALWAP